MVECIFKDCTNIGTHYYSSIVCNICYNICGQICYFCEELPIPIKIFNKKMCFSHSNIDICSMCEKIVFAYKPQNICMNCILKKKYGEHNTHCHITGSALIS